MVAQPLWFAPVFAAPIVNASAGYVPIAYVDEQDDALKAIRAGEILPYSKVRKIAEKKLKAKVVGERLRRTNQGWVYEFRARNKKGRVIFAIFSAKNGKLIARR